LRHRRREGRSRHAQENDAFLIDVGHPGFEVRPCATEDVSHGGYTNSILEFNNWPACENGDIGELHRGFEVANTWLEPLACKGVGVPFSVKTGALRNS